MNADNLPAFILYISIKSIAYIILADMCPLNSLLKIKILPFLSFFASIILIYWLLANENLQISPKPATPWDKYTITLPLDLVLHHLAHYKRSRGCVVKKTGLASPAPPCVDDPANIYTRTTFNPTSPRAPVPLLTYVKE